MVFRHGKDSHVCMAEFDLSPYLTDVSATVEAKTHDVTVLRSSSVARFAGLFDGSAKLAGLYDATIDAEIEAWVGSTAGEVFTFTVGGVTLGDPVRLGVVKNTKYLAKGPVGGMVSTTVDLEADGGIWAGVNLHPLAAETVTGTETSVDAGAGSVGVDQGGMATIHLTAVNTLTSLDVKIQDSANDSDWADIATFTQLTAVGSEKVEVALGTQVDRYLRANWTLVGTSVTFQVAFARWAHSA